MKSTLLINAEEVASELGISKAYAYRLVRKLNTELRDKGFIVIAGKVSRAYFEEKVYGCKPEEGED